MRTDGPMRRPLEWLAGRAPGAHRFLTAESGKARLGREIASVALLIVLLMGGLWGFTGQPMSQSPVVVVESGSMMHCANGVGNGPPSPSPCHASSFGRLGTIDPGDLILVKDVDQRSDIRTLADAGKQRYGEAGDVIIYWVRGDEGATPIIHRALFYIEIHQDGTVSIPAAGIERAQNVPPETLVAMGVPEAEAAAAQKNTGLIGLMQQDCLGQAGYVTRGDNNEGTDHGGQRIAGTPCPVPFEWVMGKARGEIPWIGALKLRFTDAQHYEQAPGDVKRLMWTTVIVLLAGPFAVDLVMHKLREARARRAEAADATTGGDQAHHHAASDEPPSPGDKHP